MIRILLLICLTLTVLQCKQNRDQSKEQTLGSLNINNEYLYDAIIEYQEAHILNEYRIDEILLISPITRYPYPILEFNGIDSPISLGDSTSSYILVTVQDMPVLVESFYSSLLSNATLNRKEIDEVIKLYLADIDVPPSTGYSSDTWYVIIKEDRYQVINITDSIYHYNNEEKISALMDSIICSPI